MEAEGLQLADDTVGDRTLLPGRALDRGQLEKEPEGVIDLEKSLRIYANLLQSK